MTQKKSTPPSGSAGRKKSAATKPAAKVTQKRCAPSKAAGKPTAKAPAPSKAAGRKKSLTPLEKSVKPTTDKVGDVLVNQAGIEYKIVGERYVEPWGDGVKIRRLTVKPEARTGERPFEVSDHEFQTYRKNGVLKRKRR